MLSWTLSSQYSIDATRQISTSCPQNNSVFKTFILASLEIPKNKVSNNICLIGLNLDLQVQDFIILPFL